MGSRTRADATEDPELMALLAMALEKRDSGEPVVIADLCRERPELATALAEALGLAAQVGQLSDRSQDVDTRLGQVLARRYRLEQRLGAGAMGVVYRAADLQLKRNVAIKLLQSDLFSAPEASARFLREAEVLAAVQHRAVVTVYDRGAVGDGPMFVAMELLDGAPLSALLDAASERLRSGNSSDSSDWLREVLGDSAELDASYLRQVVRWAADLAAGLHAAHQAGVFHRDVKPSNVFVRRDGSAVLLDFGVASRSSERTLAQRDAAIGTPAYMAPEQLRGGVAPAATLDVYGLTAALYHMLVLVPPYTGTISEVMARLQRHDPVPAYRVRPGLPRDLQAILDRGMAREPGQRYASAAQLEADLRSFLAYRPVVARPVGVLGRVWRKAKRSPELRVAGLLLIAGLLVTAGLAWRNAARVARAADFDHEWARLLPAITLVSRPNRVVVDPQERAVYEVRLAKLVATQAMPLPAQLLRAAFRFDHGDRAGAAVDMRAVADGIGGAYLAALSARYESVSADGALDLAGLPEPKTPEEQFVAAHQGLRAGVPTAMPAAIALVQGDVPAHLAPMRELLAPALVERARRLTARPARLQAFRDLQDLVVQMEHLAGRRSAMTAHVLGSALVGQERFREALRVLRAGVELSPTSLGLHNNLGIALARLGRFAEAESVLRRAIALRGASLEAWENLARAYLWAFRFDDLRATVAAGPFESSAAGRSVACSMLGNAAYGEALQRRVEGKREAAAELARKGIELLEQSIGLGVQEDADSRAACEALLVDDSDGAVIGYLAIMARDPVHWQRIALLADTLPEALSAASTASLRDYLRALATHLSNESRLLEAEEDPPSPLNQSQPSSSLEKPR